jgi:serine/threonine-protein kinase
MGARSEPPAVVQKGDVIAGKFLVERVLGAGGMGVVVEVRHIQLNQRAALKFLRPEAASHPVTAVRFLREAQAAAGIKSEHVVRVSDVGTLDDGRPYLVMEYLEGTDLRALLEERKRLPVADAVDYVLQACEAIAEAHRLGIVHRDLKPANLFLTERADGSPLVKVLDFGIAKALSEGEAGALRAGLTSTNAAIGSTLYMPPEQVRNAKNVDARADVWSLGVILHELVAGTPPFDGDSASAVCAAIVADPPASLLDKVPDAPAALDDVILRCLDKDIAGRYRTVGDLALALRPFASTEGRVSADRASRVAARSRDTPPERGERGERAERGAEARPATEVPTVDERARSAKRAADDAKQRPVAATAGESAWQRVTMGGGGGRAAAFAFVGVLAAGAVAMGLFVALRPSSPAGATPASASQPPTVDTTPVPPAAPEPTHAPSAMPMPSATSTQSAMPAATPTPTGSVVRPPSAPRRNTAPSASSSTPKAPDPLSKYD